MYSCRKSMPKTNSVCLPSSTLRAVGKMSKRNPFSINFIREAGCVIRTLLFMISFHHVHWHNDYIKHTATSFSAFFPYISPLSVIKQKRVDVWEKEIYLFGSRSIVSARNFFLAIENSLGSSLWEIEQTIQTALWIHLSLKTIENNRTLRFESVYKSCLLNEVQNSRSLASFVPQNSKPERKSNWVTNSSKKSLTMRKGMSSPPLILKSFNGKSSEELIKPLFYVLVGYQPLSSGSSIIN